MREELKLRWTVIELLRGTGYGVLILLLEKIVFCFARIPRRILEGPTLTILIYT